MCSFELCNKSLRLLMANDTWLKLQAAAHIVKDPWLMGGSKPGFYQASPVTEGGIMGKERSSLRPSLSLVTHDAVPQ